VLHGQLAIGVIAPDQACNLRHAQPAQLAEQGSHLATLLLAQSEVLLLHQRGRNPLVNSASALAGKISSRIGLEKTIDPIQRQRFRIFHLNLHPPNRGGKIPISGSSCIGQFWQERGSSGGLY
jgi:hypothetical protein